MYFTDLYLADTSQFNDVLIPKNKLVQCVLET